MIILFLSSLSVLASTTQSAMNCDGYYECSEQMMADRTSCYGFGSCSFATIASDHGLNCDGFRSCYLAKLFLAETIKCRSTASCESALIRRSDELHCEGPFM